MRQNDSLVKTTINGTQYLTVNTYALIRRLIIFSLNIILFIPRKIIVLLKFFASTPKKLGRASVKSAKFAVDHKAEIKQSALLTQSLLLKIWNLGLFIPRLIKNWIISIKTNREKELEELSLDLQNSIEEIEQLFPKINESFDFTKLQNARQDFRKLKGELKRFKKYNPIQVMKEFKSYKEAKDYQVALLMKKADRIEKTLSELKSQQIIEEKIKKN